MNLVSKIIALSVIGIFFAGCVILPGNANKRSSGFNKAKPASSASRYR